MRKKKLVVDHQIDFLVWGLVSTTKDYKLAWQINQTLKIDLVKQDDLVISFVKGADLKVSNYLFTTENTEIRLLKNRGEGKDSVNYLAPEQQQFDFFVLLKSDDDTLDNANVQALLKDVDAVNYLVLVDLEKLKSRDNFIF